ncbi:uncharacterized protein PHALS_11712 [Plasmopara halstedii]|uniref:Uncharacterized protein n=1 Tax=Plasmopara halstedii TaxID=4781 RepID=A0A0P1AJW0_PLAHL|nr:uncharacterized protein PHALS_11712 [Plasmopara halstedii]CEG41362.1 hypothetical protein PHALS_11712 [Plasmopara halstedii]|eukprot:XP_024577731.1 hypothetical protein PHALS_11712 [Plasmopara halstedii]
MLLSIGRKNVRLTACQHPGKMFQQTALRYCFTMNSFTIKHEFSIFFGFNCAFSVTSNSGNFMYILHGLTFIPKALLLCMIDSSANSTEPLKCDIDELPRYDTSGPSSRDFQTCFYKVLLWRPRH